MPGLLLPFAALAAVLAPAPEIARGRVVDGIACASDPAQTYAVYLPAGYDAGRSWPILYVLDARRRGAKAAEVFREGAQAHGWILASSNNSASDGALEPSLEAVQAMWGDTHERFAIDPRRRYVAGFSGTARVACTVAQPGAGRVAGVIGCGAGFPDAATPARDVSFAWFGAIGDADFTYREMRTLDRAFQALGLPHRLAVFEGGHSWPPPEVARRAIAWMELQAIRRGARPRDEALIEALYRERAAEAETLESAGRLEESFAGWSELAEDFSGLRDVSAARKRATSLSTSREVRKAIKARSRREEREEEASRRLRVSLSSGLSSDKLVAVPALLHELRLAELQRGAQSADHEASLSARRLLAELLVQTGFYLPRDFTERGEHRKAALCREVAAAIEPDDSRIQAELARARARNGEKKLAREALRAALASGLPREEAAADSLLAPLLEEF